MLMFFFMMFIMLENVYIIMFDIEFVMLYELIFKNLFYIG